MAAQGVTVGGRYRRIPGAYSQVFARNLAQQSGAGRTVAIIGNSTGGEPLVAHEFYSPAEAKAVLRSGDLLTACMFAWHPSPNVTGADKIVAIRAASSCTRGTMSLLNSTPAATVALTTRDYGDWVNNIRVKVEAGTNVATFPGVKRITVENQLDPYRYEIGDDLGKALSLLYSGDGSACAVTITVTAGVAVRLQTTCTGASDDNLDLDLTKPQFDTLQKLVAYIDSLANYSATLYGDADRSSGTLDPASSVAIKTEAAIHFPAILACCIDWFNANSQYISAARSSTSVVLPPANLAWTNFTDGDDGTVDSAAFTAALAALEPETDVAYVVETTGDVSRQAQVLAHVEDMERTKRLRQRAFFGAAAGVSVANARTYAAQLRGPRASYYAPGIKRADEADALATYGGWAVAAMAAGMSVGLFAKAALTNKSIQAGGVESKLSQGDIGDLLAAGVCPVESVPGRGVRIVQGLTTDVSSDAFYSEQSNMDISDAIVGGLEAMLEARYVGQFGNASLAQAVYSDTETWLRSWEEKGCLVAGDTPAFDGIKVTLDGNVVSVSYNARIAGSVNFIVQTASFSLGMKTVQ